MAQLIEDVRNDKIELVAKSHSTISVESCSQLLGLTREQTAARCQALGWAIEGEFIKPVKSASAVTHVLNSDQLQALTGTCAFSMPSECACCVPQLRFLRACRGQA